MSNDELHRRTVLALAGGALTTGLAGCATSAPTANQAGGGTETSTPTPPSTDSHEEESTHEGESNHGEESSHEETEADGHHEPAEHHEEEATHTDEGHGAEGPTDHVEVAMQSTASGEHFHPHVAWVEPGGTVTFHNESGAHTATAYHPDNGKPQRIPDGAEPFDSGLLSDEGATFEHTFETEGVYDVYCAPHESLGMIGSVVVGEPDPHDQPGLADPQSGMSDRAASKLTELNEQVDTMLGHTH